MIFNLLYFDYVVFIIKFVNILKMKNMIEDKVPFGYIGDFELFFYDYPKTNNKMEEKSIKIQIPDGYEIDEAKSSFTEIKFKPIEDKYPDSWEEAFLGKRISGHYIDIDGDIVAAICGNYTKKDRNIFFKVGQAKAALAYAQLTQLMALPCYNGDWEADWEDGRRPKYVIIRKFNELEKSTNYCYYEEIAFKSPEIRDIFFDKYQDLLQTYYQIK